MENDYELDKEFNSIQNLIQHYILNIEDDIKLLEIENKEWEQSVAEKDSQCYHTSIPFRLNLCRMSATSSIIKRLKNEKTIFSDAFDDDMIEDIQYVLDSANITKHLGYINRKIIEARVEIVRFIKSSLGSNDYERDIKAIKNKIEDIQEYTEVNNFIEFPSLPHNSIKKLTFNLCDKKKLLTMNIETELISKETVKEIITIISLMKRAPGKQADFDKKATKRLLKQNNILFKGSIPFS